MLSLEVRIRMGFFSKRIANEVTQAWDGDFLLCDPFQGPAGTDSIGLLYIWSHLSGRFQQGTCEKWNVLYMDSEEVEELFSLLPISIL